MEADVALHTSEAWATSADPRAEKIKYVYSNRRKERDSRAAGRKTSSSSRIQQMKPSRSYDNELESSVRADLDLSQQPLLPSSPAFHKARDDSALKYTSEKSRSSPTSSVTAHHHQQNISAGGGSNSARLGGHSSRSPAAASGQIRTKQSPELSAHRDHYAAERQGRWRPRNKNTSRGKPPAGDRNRADQHKHHQRKTLEKQSSLPEASMLPTEAVSSMTTSGHKLKLASSLDDQLQMTGKPKIAALDLQHAAGRSERTRAGSSSSQGIVLEVKDGPSVHFRPSDTMLSDNSSLDCLRNTAVRDINIYNPDERPLPALQAQKQNSAVSSGVKHVKTPEEYHLPPTTAKEESAKAPQDLNTAAATPIPTASTPQVNPTVSQRINHDDIVVGPTSSQHRMLFGGGIIPGSQALSSFSAEQEASDETAFCSPSIMFQQKAGIRHDDMVVGPVSRLDPFRMSPYPVDSSESDLSSTPVPLDLVPSIHASSATHDTSISAASSTITSGLSNSPTGWEHSDFIAIRTAEKDYNNSVGKSSRVAQDSRETCIDGDFHHRHHHHHHHQNNSNNNNNNNSCDSQNSTAKSPFDKVKDVEMKPRGSSPGSGIPVRRGAGGGSGDRSRDRSRGTSPSMKVVAASEPLPVVDAGTILSSPSVAEDFNSCGSSHSLPGRGEHHVRWRPKDKSKAGGVSAQGMRREGKKKEKNVSTESGYITDQTFYSEMPDAVFSPESAKADPYSSLTPSHLDDRERTTAFLHSMVPAHGSLDRIKTKPLHHTSRIPSSPSSRSRSAHTTPVKKSSAGGGGGGYGTSIVSPSMTSSTSKGQPLSNIPIPVPISHDERHRKPPLPSFSSGNKFPPEDWPLQEWPSSPTGHALDESSTPPPHPTLVDHEHQQQKKKRNKKILDLADSMTISPVATAVMPPEAFEKESKVLCHRHQNESPTHKLRCEEMTTPTTTPPPSLPACSLASSSTASLPAATALSIAPQPLPPLSSSSSSSVAITSSSLVAAAVSASSSSSSTVMVKPRLHRSAEHLLAGGSSGRGPKLAIYRGPDEGDQPDSASDVSVATACSMPAKMVAGTRPDLPDSDFDLTDSSRRKKAQHTKMISNSGGDLLDKSSDLGMAKLDKRWVASQGAPKGRCVSLLRREKERSKAIVRRGSDRAVPVDRNDPSAMGLKAATSHKELCQSMASLLNIDNEKAAEMLSTSLSKRQDLVEGLDADAIMDYLTHHGVLDPSVLRGLGSGGVTTPGEVSVTQRNSAILQHVEAHGDTAVALFINALRQSGQLHLASSLDTEQRIRPAVSGNTYFGKSRHKGEICVRLEVEALKILAPREPTERNVNLSLLSSPSHGNDGPTVLVDDDDDQVKPKSCWCFCISRKHKSSRSSSKKDRRKNKYKEAQNNKDGAGGEVRDVRDSSLPPPNATRLLHSGGSDHWTDPDLTPHRTKSMDRENNFTTRHGTKGSSASFSPASSSLPSTPQRSKTPAKSTNAEKKKNAKKGKHKSSSSSSPSGKPHVPATIQESQASAAIHDVPDVAFRSTGVGAGAPADTKKSTPKDLRLKDAKKDNNSDGIIMEYDAQLELVKLRAGHDELASPTRQSGGPMGILVEQWKYSGKHFLGKADLLCQAIVDEFHTEIIKYFEQDRGTLVLDVVSEGTAVVVFNICMTKAQVQRLEKDDEDGALLERLKELFTSRVDISKFDIRGVQYRTVVDQTQLNSVLSELS